MTIAANTQNIGLPFIEESCKKAIETLLHEGPWQNTFRPLSQSEGLCGNLCQLIDLFEENRDETLQEYIEIHYLKAKALADHTTSNNVSFGQGLYGLVYLQLRLFEVTGKQDYLEQAMQLIDHIAKKQLLSLNNEMSIERGLAGILCVMLKVLVYQPADKVYSGIIDNLAFRLVESIRPSGSGGCYHSIQEKKACEPGLRMGNTGIAFTFIQLGKMTQTDTYSDIAKHLLVYERQLWQQHNPEDNVLEYLEFAQTCCLYDTLQKQPFLKHFIQEPVSVLANQVAISDWENHPVEAINELRKQWIATYGASSETCNEDIHLTGLKAGAFMTNMLKISAKQVQCTTSLTLTNYHRTLLDKRYPLCAELMGKLMPEQFQSLLADSHDRPLQAFERLVETRLAEKKHAELDWKYRYEKQKGDWLENFVPNSLEEENANCEVIDQLLKSEDMYKVPLILRPDNLFISLEEQVDVLSIDPSDRKTLSRVFMTYGIRSWLIRKYHNLQPLEIELFFVRPLLDQYQSPCTIGQGIDRCIDYLLSLNERCTKMLKRISSYDGEQTFEAHLREIYHDFMYELVFEGFVSLPEAV